GEEEIVRPGTFCPKSEAGMYGINEEVGRERATTAARLERFPSCYSVRVAAGTEVVAALAGAELVQHLAQVLPQFLDRPLGPRPQLGLELAERFLDRVEVRAVRRQQPQLSP